MPLSYGLLDSQLFGNDILVIEMQSKWKNQ